MVKKEYIKDMKPSRVPMNIDDLHEISDEPVIIEPIVEPIVEPTVVSIPEIQDMTPLPPEGVKPPSHINKVRTDEILSLEEESKVKTQQPENLGQSTVKPNSIVTPIPPPRIVSETPILDDKRYIWLLGELESLYDIYESDKEKYADKPVVLMSLEREYNRKVSEKEAELNQYPQYASDVRRQKFNAFKSSVGSKLESAKGIIGRKYKTFNENLSAGGGYGITDEEYARKAGYKGEDKSTLDLKIKSTDDALGNLTSRRRNLEISINELIDAIDSNDREIIKLERDLRDANNQKDKDRINSKIIEETRRRTSNESLKAVKEKELTKLDDSIKKSVDDKSKYERQRNEFYNYKEQGAEKYKREHSFARSAGKYGTAAQESVSNVFTPPGGKGLLKKDWYGDKGFMSHGYTKQSITSNPITPVRTNLSNLDNLTRSTGSAVGRDMVNSIVNIRKGNVIAPLGVPGTIGRSGISDRYSYSTPLKKIQVADVYTNVNREFIPSIMQKKIIPLQMQQNPKPIVYKQMMQSDGTIINVPVQQRKSKKVSPVNRVNAGISNIVNYTGKSDSKVDKNKVDKKTTAIDNIVNSINKMGTVKPNKDVIPKKKQGVNMFTVKHYDFGLSLNKKPEVQVEVVEPKERKSKQVDPIVNILSNINNMTKKKKKI